MLYCQGSTVSFQEVPDEVSLVFQIADCPFHCPGCHSPQLWEAEGTDLESCMDQEIEKYRDAITCVCFMGEGQDKEALERCANRVKNYWNLHTALYTGNNVVPVNFCRLFDYIKMGPYIKELGGLDNPNTNQKMFYIEWQDDWFLVNNITERFQRRNS